MALLLLGITLGTIGKIILGVIIIIVHNHIIKERKIDLDVLRTMRKERIWSILGLVLIITSYILEIMYYI